MPEARLARTRRAYQGYHWPGHMTWMFPQWSPALSVGCCTLNGRIVYAWSSASERLHVWDGLTVRRVDVSGNPMDAGD